MPIPGKRAITINDSTYALLLRTQRAASAQLDRRVTVSGLLDDALELYAGTLADAAAATRGTDPAP